MEMKPRRARRRGRGPRRFRPRPGTFWVPVGDHISRECRQSGLNSSRHIINVPSGPAEEENSSARPEGARRAGPEPTRYARESGRYLQTGPQFRWERPGGATCSGGRQCPGRCWPSTGAPRAACPSLAMQFNRCPISANPTDRPRRESQPSPAAAEPGRASAAPAQRGTIESGRLTTYVVTRRPRTWYIIHSRGFAGYYYAETLTSSAGHAQAAFGTKSGRARVQVQVRRYVCGVVMAGAECGRRSGG